MTDWPFVRLEEIAADERSSISKPYGSAIVREDYVSEGVPVVRGVNLSLGRFHDDGFVFISHDLADKMPGARLQSGDLVFTHRGSIGQVSMIPRSPRFARYAVSTSQVKARLDSRKALPEFFYYWFQSPAGQQSIQQGISTVGVPGLARPVETIKALRVPLPSIEEQQRVALVLVALDDLIETNRALIRKLTETAVACFRRFEPSSASDLTYGDVAAIGGGGTPSTKNPDNWDGDIRWATPSDLTALWSPFLFDTRRKISAGGLAACSSDLYPAGTILMTSRATIGVFAIAQVPTAVNQGFIVVRPASDADGTFLLLEMMHRVPDYLAHANGSTFLEISRGKFKALTVAWPSDEDRDRLHEELSPLLRSAAQLEVEVGRLTQTRDELLPLLMSGKVRVSHDLAVA